VLCAPSGSRMIDSPLTSELRDRLWVHWGSIGAPLASSDGASFSVVDPEALLIGTAAVTDARMSEVALSWSRAHRGLLSIARTKHLLRGWPDLSGWSSFAGQLSMATEISWPEASSQALKVALVNVTRSLRRTPQTSSLRIRSAFGVSARSEILSAFLRRPDGTHVTASGLVDEVAYTKRNISTALLSLEQAGLLVRFRVSNSDRFHLANPESLREVFAPAPPESYPFAAWLKASVAMAKSLDVLSEASESVRSVEARQVLDRLRGQGTATFRPPSIPPGDDSWDPVRSWARTLIQDPTALVQRRS